MIQILGLLGMYFDAVVVEVKTFLLLFRLALAILCEHKVSDTEEKCYFGFDSGKNVDFKLNGEDFFMISISKMMVLL